MSEHRSSEWPLVVFTVGLQLCCGITIAATAVELTGAGTAYTRPLAIAVFPLALVALLGSTFHLGKPLAAYRAICNLGASRLSAEVAVTGLFAFATFIFSFLWVADRPELRVAAGLVTAVLGVAAVLASARIYTLPTQPFWYSGWVISQFIGATLVLSGSFGAFCVRQATFAPPQNFWVGAVSVGAILVLASAYWMIRRLQQVAKTRYEAPCAPPLVTRTDWASLTIFILLGGIVPLLIGGSGLFAAGITGAVSLAVLILALIGITLGRVFMYSLGTELSRF